MRILLSTLVLIAIATPAAATSADDFFGWIFSIDDRNASPTGQTEVITADLPTATAPRTSFLSDPLPPFEPEQQDRLPQIPDGGIPLEWPDSHEGHAGGGDWDAGHRSTSPVPEPTGALLFAAGACLMAARLRR